MYAALTLLHNAFESVLISTGTLTVFSRAMVAAVWLVALVDVWRHRDAPMANQAMAAASALIIGQFALIYHQHIPIDTLFFFLAMGQLVMATSVMRMFRWASRIPDIHIQMANAKDEDREAISKNAVIVYTRAFLVVAITGIAYFFLTWLELGEFWG